MPHCEQSNMYAKWPRNWMLGTALKFGQKFSPRKQTKKNVVKRGLILGVRIISIISMGVQICSFCNLTWSQKGTVQLIDRLILRVFVLQIFFL